MLQLCLETHLIHSPENNLHNRVVFYFIKSNIISAITNGPAYSRNSQPDQIPNLNIMIGKPTSEQMAYAPTLRQPGSNRNNPPNHSCKMAAKEEVELFHQDSRCHTFHFLSNFSLRGCL
jgi:hypothetical protein